ncbi:MAG: ABC transporter permease [Butyrivibrio sp.]|nr:ABC transporter permease [Butyrivibrio sp.]
MKFRTYFLKRLGTWALTIWIGVTFIFFIPRMFPSDPVESMIGQIAARSGSMDPVQMESLRRSLRVQFGLEGTLMEQYTTFLWKGLLHFDFGPSLMSYPESAGNIISTYLPYTVGLSMTATLLAWVIGNLIGLLAGFRKNKRSSIILEGIAICIYPIPYFIVALVLQIFLHIFLAGSLLRLQ